MALPRFAVFKSNYNSKYLSYEKDDGVMHGYIRFTGEEVLSPYAKFALEPSKSANGTLVHIRCCYNNKYWVRSSDSQHWIVAASDNQEEDNSKWSCTLFEPVYLNDDDKTTARFRHLQLGNYACLFRSADEYASCVIAEWDSPNNDLCDVFTIINWESLLILPKRIAFKGANGKYLSSTENILLQQFTSSDIGDPKVGFEVFTTSDGSLRIKSDYLPGTRWVYSQVFQTISNGQDIDQDDKSDLFWPIKVDNNVIALRNVANNNFCRSAGGDDNYVLVADLSTITKEARLEVEELVMSRVIYDVNYRLDDARIYNENVTTMGNAIAINRSEKAETVELSFTKTESTSTFWNASVSLTVGVSTTFETGIPFIAEGKITVSTEISGGYKWGKTEETKKETVEKYTVTVPPMTMTTVSYMATQGTCDVPFSYTQEDTLFNGEKLPTLMNDGLYTGINSYNMYFDHHDEKL